MSVYHQLGTTDRLSCSVSDWAFNNNNDDDDNNNNLRLFDCRHTAQSNTTGREIQQPPRRAALYTEGLSGKRQATNGAQRLINRTWLNLVSTHQMELPEQIR